MGAPSQVSRSPPLKHTTADYHIRMRLAKTQRKHLFEKQNNTETNGAQSLHLVFLCHLSVLPLSDSDSLYALQTFT